MSVTKDVLRELLFATRAQWLNVCRVARKYRDHPGSLPAEFSWLANMPYDDWIRVKNSVEKLRSERSAEIRAAKEVERKARRQAYLRSYMKKFMANKRAAAKQG